ncbi:MAG: hypothetical protein RJA61_482 [Candidatus Parcubacteria bacterium]|jgi:predicted anti-sigma-YlaC factor YlaD
MIKQIGDIAAMAFIVFVGIFTVMGVFSIWEVVSGEVLTKSLMTMGILTLATIVVLVFSHFTEGSSRSGTDSSTPFNQ